MPARIILQKGIIIALLVALLSANAVAQWTKTAGPPGMNINQFYKSGNVLYAGTSAKGVFKSANNGINWQASNAGIKNNNVYTLISNGNFLFAGTDNGVFRSSDNGTSWQPANTGLEQKFVVSFHIDNGFLYAGTVSTGLFKSSNNGNSWTDANGNALNSSTIHAITCSSQHLVVVSDNLIFYSDDNGDSWFYEPSSPFILTGLPSFLTSSDSLLLVVGQGVYRSFDGGVHWGNFIRIDRDENISGLMRINNNRIMAGSKKGVYFSKNFGRTWIIVAAKGLRTGNWINRHFFASGNNLLLAYDEIGLAYSTDKGSNWNYTLSNFTPSATIDNALAATGNILLSGTHGNGLYQSNNTGNTWTKIGTTNNNDILSNSNIFAVLRVNNNIILAGTCGNGLYRTKDNGLTWSRVKNGLPEQQGTGFLCVNSLARTTTNILIGTDQGLYYSADNGASWNSTNISGDGFDIVGVAANGAVACAASESFILTNKVFRSTNNGKSWTSVFETNVADFASMASDGNSHFYVGMLNSTNILSNNNGLTWQSFGPGIPPGNGAYAIGVLNKNVFAGNNGGVYFSNNNGVSFTQQNTGFDPAPNNIVQGFTFSATDIYAGLFQNSVWKRSLSDFGISSIAAIDNSDNELATITPNPIIGESQLVYHVPGRSVVVINMYNANGDLIKQLVNEIQGMGRYNIHIMKNRLHEGNYFISVVIGNKHTSIPVVIK